MENLSDMNIMRYDIGFGKEVFATHLERERIKSMFTKRDTKKPRTAWMRSHNAE